MVGWICKTGNVGLKPEVKEWEVMDEDNDESTEGRYVRGMMR